MAEARVGDTVGIHYQGKLKDGTVFSSSQGQDPLRFKVGENATLPDLERSVVGMSIGETATVEIAAGDAFGPHRPEAIKTVERTLIDDNVDLSVGTKLQASTAEGQQIMFTVIELNDDTVTLDGNHPLAGEDLVFEIELVEVQAEQG